GKTLRYGLIFRGGQMNRQDPPTEEDKVLMKEVLGIKADVDLRWDSELDGGTPDDPSDDLYFTPLGDGVEYAHMPVNLYALWKADTTQWNNMLSFMMDHVIAGEPCYVHCAAGADRTGTTCFLLEGLLGVPELSLTKEYELTSFSIYGERLRNGPNGYGPMVNYILERKGETLRDKFEDYFTEYVGIPKEKIEAFRAAMLDVSP
ncbi:MAG: tyrosine-protein phosphatase, partial [Bacteroidales bacterium]|nr:tyrosine-protein phosphatase [Bacteroidales bacterium]